MRRTAALRHGTGIVERHAVGVVAVAHPLRCWRRADVTCAGLGGPDTGIVDGELIGRCVGSYESAESQHDRDEKTHSQRIPVQALWTGQRQLEHDLCPWIFPWHGCTPATHPPRTVDCIVEGARASPGWNPQAGGTDRRRLAVRPCACSGREIREYRARRDACRSRPSVRAWIDNDR